jgi:hypothetical protein
VYEFLYRPGACFFVDVYGGVGADGTPELDFWRNGPVVKSVEELSALLPQHRVIAAQYREMQIDRLAYTADMSDPRPASIRGASAIRDYVNRY